jgi:endonuclease/exonuclease/phosphatase (EEP) superfamily protein YafD
MGTTDSSAAGRPAISRLRRVRDVCTGALRLAVVVAGAASACGFFAAWWWPFEGLCHFRVQYALVLLCCGMVLQAGRRWRWAAVAGVLAVVNAAVIIPLYVPAKRGTQAARGLRVRVVAANVFSGNHETARVLDFVRETSPDILAVLELTPRWADELESLSDLLPHRVIEPRDGNFGLGLYSRHAIDEFEIVVLSEHNPAIVARLALDDAAPLTVIAAHPYPPAGARGTELRNRQLRRLGELAAQQPAPVVLLGDINSTSWSPAFSELVRASGLCDTRRGIGVQPTWPAGREPLRFMLRIPIDHCLTSPDICVADRSVGPNVGSDHFPVIADLALALQSREDSAAQ